MNPKIDANKLFEVISKRRVEIGELVESDYGLRYHSAEWIARKEELDFIEEKIKELILFERNNITK